MHNVKEKLQLKAGQFGNAIISGQKFNNISVYEGDGKYIQSVFKEYQYALPEDKSSIVFPIFHDIVKLLMMCGSGKSKDILSTYYIKFRHSKIFLSYY